VAQGNVGLVTKFGRFYRAVDPGLVKINPLSERLTQVDVKIQIVGMFNSHWYYADALTISQRFPSKFA
jgi:regulator of protease activity HflC (stomatin/prohibitin superfamily)